MLSVVRLQHGSKVGICTSVSLLSFLHGTAVGLLVGLLVASVLWLKNLVPYWQIPNTNGTSSTVMELLVLIQLW